MRVLHIGDQAGVAFILAKYQGLQGLESKVVKISGNDKFGIDNFYQDNPVFVPKEVMLERLLAEITRAEIIHIHSNEDILFMLRKKFGKSKRFIMHYHGTDLRGICTQKLPHRSWLSDQAVRSIYAYRAIKDKLFLSKERRNLRAQEQADAVIVSTPDLLELCSRDDAYYLPNPVDTDHFKVDPTSENGKKEALTIDSEATNIQHTINYCKRNNVEVEIETYDRTRRPIAHSEMPNFLKKYRIYVDIRFVDNQMLENLSKTALEALACGLSVLDYKLAVRRGLPSKHDPMNVVKTLSTIY
jgi:glycosyltransferase involved in cell wall biosynthesis